MNSLYEIAFIQYNEVISNSKWNFWKNKKIIIAGMTKVIEAVYSLEPIALGVGIYGIYDFAKYNPFCLTGILNSKFLTFYLRENFKDKHLAGGYMAINKSTLEKLPLVEINKNDQDMISALVEEIQFLKRANPKADTSALEAKIDQLVYQLYGLKEEEIKIVEKP